MTSTTTALLQNLATLRATRDAIMAEIDAINSAPAGVEPLAADLLDVVLARAVEDEAHAPRPQLAAIRKGIEPRGVRLGMRRMRRRVRHATPPRTHPSRAAKWEMVLALQTACLLG